MHCDEDFESQENFDEHEFAQVVRVEDTFRDKDMQTYLDMRTER